jgi:hypothetical protein
VKCPKCGNVFKVPEEEIHDVIPFLAEEPATQPAPSKKHYTEDEEDDGPATYRFVDEPARKIERDEEEDYEDKEDISIVPDLTVKDPRGIAQELLIRPSNWLMLMSVLDIIFIFLVMCWILIPIFFSLPPDTSPGGDFAPPVAQKKETVKAGGISYTAPNFGLANWLTVLLVFAIGGFLLAYNGLIVLGTVKMQNLESYGMCIAACILAMVPVSSLCYMLRLLFGVVCLISLKNPAVVAGFEYKGEQYE